MSTTPTPPVQRVRMFIDESGDHNPPKGADDFESRFLGLVGVVFDLDGHAAFSKELEELKGRHFKGVHTVESPVVLHRKDIMRRRENFTGLNDPKARGRFDEDLLHVMRRGHYYVMCCVLDKHSHGEKTYRALSHPYHYGLIGLLQRYCGRLKNRSRRGDVMVESRGKLEDRALANTYRGIFERGSVNLSHSEVRRTLVSNKLLCKPKEANIAGLQLADLFAHTLTRVVLSENGLLSATPSDFAHKIAAIADEKYNAHFKSKRVPGYGRILLS